MGQYTSYYLYQKFEKRDGQDFIPVYPNTYSVDADGTMPRVVKNENDENCGYVPPTPTAIYRWVQVTPTSDPNSYWCDECTIEPIYRWTVITPTSDPSTYYCDECPIVPIYRWANSGTTCVNCDKYQRGIKQVSYDNGSTWDNVYPAEYSATTLIEENSYDCGYRARTTSGSPYCNGVDKYIDVYSQVSYNSGNTWTTTATTHSLIEANSEDCGYVPPTPIDFSTQYFTFVAIDSGTFSFSGTSSSTINNSSIQYSTDSGSTWNTLNRGVQSPTISAGQKIMWKSSALQPINDNIDYVYGIGTFTSTGRFNAEGNSMSLFYGDNFSGQTNLSGKVVAFEHLFRYCSGLISAENLILPATTLEEGCYCYMFWECTSLTTPPALPATTLAVYCYASMFAYCSSLRTSPELPATTLTSSCYSGMFYGCTSLNYVKCLATNISAYSCTSDWLFRVASSGTFVKNSSMSSWPSGADGIPSNWTVQNA